MSGEIENVILKVTSLEDALGDQIQQYSKERDALKEERLIFSGEVESLKEIRETLLEMVSTAISQKMKEAVPSLVGPLVESLAERSQDIIDRNIEVLERVNRSAQNTISQCEGALSSYDRDRFLKKLWLSGVFCLGALLSSGVIFYLFPQHVYYGFTDEFLKTYFVGRAVRDNYESLSKKDQILIEQKYKNIYR